MAINLVQSARRYVDNDPAQWQALVGSILHSFYGWVARQLLLRKEEAAQLRFTGLAESLNAFLLDPRSVSRFASCSSDGAVVTLIKEGMDGILSKSDTACYRRGAPATLLAEGESGLERAGCTSIFEDANGIVASDLWGAVPLKSLVADYWVPAEEEGWWPTVEIGRQQADFSEDNGKEKGGNGEVTQSVFRLDVIDIPLYKALLMHPELMKSLNWRTFEKLLADILCSFGYEVELQRGTKDGGVDIFALKRESVFGAERFLVQAKRWSNKVGIDPVRQLAFLRSHERVTKACLATTATFTRGAWELAHQYRWQLELRDFDGLCDWVSLAASRKNING